MLTIPSNSVKQLKILRIIFISLHCIDTKRHMSYQISTKLSDRIMVGPLYAFTLFLENPLICHHVEMYQCWSLNLDLCDLHLLLNLTCQTYTSLHLNSEKYN